MLILITNDDSIHAPGLMTLVDCATGFGDVIVVAPDAPQSGQSSALSVNKPLRIKRLPDRGTAQLYTVSGTPVDCVKLALNAIVPRKPDLLLSGINHGSNSGNAITYSGTMGLSPRRHNRRHTLRRLLPTPPLHQSRLQPLGQLRHTPHRPGHQEPLTRPHRPEYQHPRTHRSPRCTHLPRRPRPLERRIPTLHRPLRQPILLAHRPICQRRTHRNRHRRILARPRLHLTRPRHPRPNRRYRHTRHDHHLQHLESQSILAALNN